MIDARRAGRERLSSYASVPDAALVAALARKPDVGAEFAIRREQRRRERLPLWQRALEGRERGR